MDYPEYRADLQRIHESEVYGIVLFRTAASLTLNADRKRKWLVLMALEEKTLSRYLEHMQATGQAIKEPVGWRAKGAAEGAALALMPWRMAMKLLRDGTAPFQEKFLRLKQHADEAQQAFFDYIYAHEKAIEAFASKELAGEPDSTAAAESLVSR